MTTALSAWFALYNVQDAQVTSLYCVTGVAGTSPEAKARTMHLPAEVILAADERACLFTRRGRTLRGEERTFTYLLIRYEDLMTPDPWNGIRWADPTVTALAQSFIDRLVWRRPTLPALEADALRGSG